MNSTDKFFIGVILISYSALMLLYILLELDTKTVRKIAVSIPFVIYILSILHALFLG